MVGGRSETNDAVVLSMMTLCALVHELKREHQIKSFAFLPDEASCDPRKSRSED